MLAASMLVVLAVAVASVQKLGAADPAAWATLAAVLAVVAAVASAWTSQRVLELQEDAQQPNPAVVLDLRSRYQLAQFRITNHGGAAAHNVRITWQRQLRDADGNDVLLGRDVPIPVIPQGESATVGMGVSNDFIRAHADTTCGGIISFANASGRRFARPFVVSAEHERIALVHSEETPKTQFELQKIPKELERVAREIAALGQVIERSSRIAPSNNELQPPSGAGKPAAARS
jgi:hypothetical protein